MEQPRITPDESKARKEAWDRLKNVNLKYVRQQPALLVPELIGNLSSKDCQRIAFVLGQSFLETQKVLEKTQGVGIELITRIKAFADEIIKDDFKCDKKEILSKLEQILKFEEKTTTDPHLDPLENGN